MCHMDSHSAALGRRRRTLGLIAALGTALVLWLATAGAAGAYPTLPGTIWTIAGDGSPCAVPTGGCGDGPDATAAQFLFVSGVAVDGDGNVYIADANARRLRKVTPAGAISTVAGDGTFCSTPSCGDGPGATAAQLGLPSGVAVDGAGRVYIADQGNHKIRKLSPAGAISTIAGNGSACSASTGTCGDGPDATAAQLRIPDGVAVDGVGNVYIADRGNHKIRKVSPAGTISTIAGNGTACAPRTSICGDGPNATAAQLASPQGVAVDDLGNVYIADSSNNKIRKVTPAGAISTVAGDGTFCSTLSCGDGPDATAAQLSAPAGVAVDRAGTVYIADSANHKVRKLTAAGSIATIAGTGSPCTSSPFCGDGGPGTSAMLNSPLDVAVDAAGRNVFVADTDDLLIRWLAGPQGSTVGPPGPPGPSGEPGAPGQMAAPGTVGAVGSARASRPRRPTGPRGATGPQGPPGQVVCRNNAAAKLACDLIFQPGTWKVAGTAMTARATLSRGGRVYARGRARLRTQGRRLRIKFDLVRRPRPGTYRLTLRLRGDSYVTVLRRTIRIR